MMRTLAVDPGEKRLGIAISDPTGTIASPAAVLLHRSRQADAAAIIALAEEKGADQILVGQSTDEDGQATPMGKHAARLAEEIRALTAIPVLLWDEHGSTTNARRVRIEMGVSRAKRGGHLDDLAAAIILQSYLDVNHDEAGS